MALVMLEQRAASAKSPEPQEGGSPEGNRIIERIWNPLIVPKELYLREGLNWQPHQPVSLTVEINGKRDGMKYATVMQLEPKVGFVARLGHPGAAVKFQNLHLLDVKRSGRNDVHICLGDLQWTRARAAEGVTTAVACAAMALPLSGRTASPEISEAGAIAPEASVLLVGEAGAGLLSGSSSEGTSMRAGSGAHSIANVGVDMDAGTSSDNPSHGDAASDTEEKATLTLAAERLANACVASELPASGTVAGAVILATAITEGAATSDVSTAIPRDGLNVAWTPSMTKAHTVCCGCTYCPCHLNAECSPAGPIPEQPLVDASPNGSVVAGREICFSKAGTSRDAVAVASGTAAALTGTHAPWPSDAAPATGTSGGGPASHLSYERLRNLALRPILKSTSSVNVNTKAGALDTTDCSHMFRAPRSSMGPVSLPPLRTACGSVCGATVADDSAVAGSRANCVLIPGDVIDRELVLPYALAVKRMADTHALVRLEIDGEMEDCKMQYRLVRSHDGQTLTLQGISRPLRGLVFQSICEAADGDILVRATTAAVATPPASVSAAADADAEAPLPEVTTARPKVTPASGTAAPSLSMAPVFSRSSSGRLCRPSLKLREGADGAVAAGTYRTGSTANVLRQPPICPADNACEVALRGLQPAPHQQLKHRNKAARPRPPAAAATLPLLHRVTNTDSAAATSERQQQSNCEQRFNGQMVGSKCSTKRVRSGAVTKARPPLPSIVSEGAASREEEGIVQMEERRGAPKRCRRTGTFAALPTSPQLAAPVTPAGTGSWTPATSAEAGRLRRAPGWHAGSVTYVPSPRTMPHDVEALKAGGDPVGLIAHAQSVAIDGSYHHMVLSGDEEAVAPAADADEQRAQWYSRASHVESSQLELNDDGVVTEAQRQEQAILETVSLQGSEADGLASLRSASAWPSARIYRSNTARRSQQPLHLQRVQEAPLKWNWDGAAGGGEEPHMSGSTVPEVAADTDAGADDVSGAAGADDGGGDAFSGGDAGGAAPTASSRRQKPRARGTMNKLKSKPNRHPSKISNVIRNAGAILLMIGAGRTSEMYEKQLRATFGNNPDTSKALRLLEEQGKVKREGKGYRMHPFSYKLTPVGRVEYERLLAEAGPSYMFALFMGVHLPPPSTSPAATTEGGRVVVEADDNDDDDDQKTLSEGPVAGEGDEAWDPPAVGGAVPYAKMEVEMKREELQRCSVPETSSPVLTPTNLTRLQCDVAAGALSRTGFHWPTANETAAIPLAAMPEKYSAGSTTTAATVAPPPRFPGATPPVLIPQLLTPADAGCMDPAVAQGWRSMPAATGAIAATADGNRSVNSPSASAHSAQQSNQEQHLSGNTSAAAATGPAPIPGVPKGAQCGQQQQQLLLWPPNWHPFSHYNHSLVDSAGHAKQRDIADSAQPVAVTATSLPQPPQLQPISSAGGPRGFPLMYTPIYNLSPAAAESPEQGPATQPAGSSGQVQPNDSHALYGSFGCVPYPGYGACNSTAVQPVSLSHTTTLRARQCKAEAAPKVPTSVRARMAAPQACSTIKPQSASESAAKQPQIHTPAQTPAFTGALLSPDVSLPRRLPHSPQALMPLQPSPSLPPQRQQHAHQEQPQPQPPLPLQQQQQHEQDQAAEQQQQVADCCFRYVVKLPEGGGYRAEVPSIAGTIYCSPCFASSAEAAAAADLLMSKLRPGEQLNLGIRADEASLLASLTVDQVQAMLWQIR
ncbi:hypothetical protein Vafri_7043 [Volvox africanus]|uniref:HTH three-helical bundle domain-containing protein n=1 Tax=Volvox africanus TaxID=51714 RepID=A0A8J4B072_9CHLO|nr:hypothetical protein Vafri_7043 [Volvox africanus]